MLSLSNDAKIFVYQEPVNMRKSFEGLSLAIEKMFPDMLFKAFFVFLNKKRDLIKVFYWDGDGFVIWYKRLEKGSFIRKKDSESITRKDFFMMLEGIQPKRIQKRFKSDFF